MRKLLVGVVAGAILVASQAIAANGSTLQVGDRVGPVKGAARAFQAREIPLWWYAGAAIAVGLAGYAISQNDDDTPASA